MSGRTDRSKGSATGGAVDHDAQVAAARDRSVFHRLSHGLTDFNIVGRWKIWFAASGVVLIVGVVALVSSGLNMGIDFTGGSVWQVEAGNADVADVESAMADLGYDDVQVQEVTEVRDGNDTRVLRVEAEATVEAPAETTEALDDLISGVEDLAAPDGADGVETKLGGVVTGLEDLDGPFTEAGLDHLAELKTAVEGFSATVESADDPATAADDAVESMLTVVEGLRDDEAQAQRDGGQEVIDALADLTGTPAEQVVVDRIGPSWGKQISDKAQTALVVFMLAITLFITIRFEWKMAVATVVALFHDLFVVVGLYALFGFPVTPSTVVALLTMLGFSIYDGIVVFDRVDENSKLVEDGKATYTDMCNASLNQVLMRSLNTSITSLLPIVAVLVAGLTLGNATLEEFGLALFLGLLSGAYSSLFIATPLLALLKEREPASREARERVEGRRAARSAKADDLAGATAGATKGSGADGGVEPKPRKKGRTR